MISFKNLQNGNNNLSNEELFLQLKERIKELNCLYQFSELIDNTDSIINIFSGLPYLIPSSWQYPEITCAKLTVWGKTYKSDSFVESRWKQVGHIIQNNNEVGTLEVYYIKDMPILDEGPFLKEERSLLDSICERMAKVMQRFSINEELTESKKLLQIQNDILETKNIALKEMLFHIEKEKKNIEKNVKSNIDSFIIPIIEKMNMQESSMYKNVLLESLSEISSSFGNHLESLFSTLSPREIEICHLIKKGMPSKNIAILLSISIQTVIKHRFNIRKKLGLLGEKKNLNTTLNSIY